jgi:hypothetical protein
MRNLLGGLLPLVLACAGAGSQVPIPLSQPAGSPAPAEYVPTGEVIVRGRGATFSDWRVAGPTVNLTRAEDGSWSGSLLGRNVSLKPGPGRLTGPGGDLQFLRWGDYVYVRGNLSGREVDVRFKPGAGFAVRGGKVCEAAVATVDCAASVNASGGAELLGQAAAAEAPMPQFGLALLAAML